MRDGWEIKKLGDICSKLTDGSHNPPKGIEHSDYVMLSSQNVFNDNIVLNEVRYLQEDDFLQEDRRTSVREGDVLLTIVGTVGRCAVFTGNMNVTLQRSVAVLRPQECMVPRYLMHCLIAKNASLNENAHGIAQKGIYLRQLSQVMLPVPPLPEQERIVAELDCLSSIIEKKKQQLKEYDTLAQSIFYDMFGDPITNEKGWEIKKLEEVCESDLGKTLNKSIDTGELLPYLCSINVLWGKIELSVLKEARFEPAEIERYSVKKGDLLVCEGGDIGRAAIWENDSSMLYQNALHRIRFKGTILPIFCLFNLKHLKDSGDLDSKYGKGVTIKHLVKSSLYSIPIPVPPLSLQQQFAEKVEAIEKQKSILKKSIEDAELLFNSRMDYYFN